ncbi:hypothetical protein CEXT_127791 [Caerostris extrusa]|uniref:Uncharacterized protein n=1 Tax=Caerostris extrusa TaxID=172846 RepID=A0AAV4TDY6_CAEEX|nr:hypothetical protein CEXT_127791 [Caerostris extrusa]
MSPIPIQETERSHFKSPLSPETDFPPVMIRFFAFLASEGCSQVEKGGGENGKKQRGRFRFGCKMLLLNHLNLGIVVAALVLYQSFFPPTLSCFL